MVACPHFRSSVPPGHSADGPAADEKLAEKLPCCPSPGLSRPLAAGQHQAARHASRGQRSHSARPRPRSKSLPHPGVCKRVPFGSGASSCVLQSGWASRAGLPGVLYLHATAGASGTYAGASVVPATAGNPLEGGTIVTCISQVRMQRHREVEPCAQDASVAGSQFEGSFAGRGAHGGGLSPGRRALRSSRALGGRMGLNGKQAWLRGESSQTDRRSDPMGGSTPPSATERGPRAFARQSVQRALGCGRLRAVGE